MDEAKLLEHIYQRSSTLDQDTVVVGPGDDCAVISLSSDRHVLLTTDQLIEHRHFLQETPIKDIAWKALARSVSDIAACAGEPICALATASLPESYKQADQLFDAMHHAAQQLGCPLVGGDIAMAPPQGALHLTTTLIGYAHPSRGPVLRSGAQPGDAILVSGELGGSFDLRTNNSVPHHLSFTPQVQLAQQLALTLGQNLHAMMDISDGLGIDAGRLALASNIAIAVEAAKLPITAKLKSQAQPVNRAITDGEDYELLLAVAPEATDDAVKLGCTVIGEALQTQDVTTAGAVVLHEQHTQTRIEQQGFTHASEQSR